MLVDLAFTFLVSFNNFQKQQLLALNTFLNGRDLLSRLIQP